MNKGFFEGLALKKKHADGLVDAFFDTADMAHLREAETVWNQLLCHHNTLPDELAQDILNNAALCFDLIFEETTEPEYLEKAIGLFEILIHRFPESEWLCGYFSNLGNCLLNRFEFKHESSDVVRAVGFFEKAIGLGKEHRDLPLFHNNFGNGLVALFEIQLDESLIAAAMENYQQAIDLGESDGPEVLQRVQNLISARLLCFDTFGDRKDLYFGMEVCRKYLDSNTVDSLPGSFLIVAALGYLSRFKVDGRFSDLEKTIALLESALPDFAPESLDFSNLMFNLGIALFLRYEAECKAYDLEKALNCFQKATQRIKDPNFLNNYSCALLAKFEQNYRTELLDAAESKLKEALELVIGETGYQSYLFSNLGNLFLQKFELTADYQHFEKALSCHKKALRQAPHGALSRGFLLCNLGICFQVRYELFASRADLDLALDHYEKALRLVKVGNPDRLLIWNNVSNSYYFQYQIEGELEHLDKSIEAAQKALGKTRLEVMAGGRATNLTSSLLSRFSVTNDQRDLRKVERMTSRLLLQNRHGHINTSTMCLQSSRVSFARYLKTGELVDLDKAMSLIQEALDIELVKASEKPALLNQLADIFLAYFERQNETEYLNKAQALLDPLFAEAKKWPHHLADAHYIRARCLAFRYQKVSSAPTLLKAFGAYEEAVKQGSLVHIWMALNVAVEWFQLAVLHEFWPIVIRAYDMVKSMSDTMFQAQLIRNDQLSILQMTQGVSGTAAYAFLEEGQNERALAALEEGNARLLKERLHLDSFDMVQLEAKGYGDLADAYCQAVACWRLFLKRQRVQPAKLRVARRQLKNTIDNIRAIPDFHDFQKTLTLDAIRSRLPKEYPLIYLFSEKNQIIAMVVRESEIKPFRVNSRGKTGVFNSVLKDYYSTYFAWRQNPTSNVLRKRFLSALDSFGFRLWDFVIGPLLEQLNGIDVWFLVPVGPVSFWPIHCAWKKDSSMPTGRRYLTDEILLHYLPNGSCLGVEIKSESFPEKILAIGDAQSDKHLAPPLARCEMLTAAQHFKNAEILSGENANLSRFLKAAKGADVLHFGSHGKLDLEHPENSAITLAGKQSLRIEHIFRTERKPFRLAILSACETFIPGADLPNEMISLAASLLYAGAKGVIASHWLASERTSVLLTTYFYGAWRNGLAPIKAFRQAQHWLRDTTNKEKILFLLKAAQEPKSDAARWYPHAKSAKKLAGALALEDPHEKLFQHPFYWATFSYSGQ